MSDFITSEIGTIFSTGLAIKIFDEKADDLNSAKSYIQDKFFRIFKNICLQHNFIIDKHMPWVIVYRVSDAYMRSNLSRYLDVYESDLLFFFDAIKIAYIYYVKNILSKELYSSVDISNFDLPKDCILKIYVKKKLDGHKIHYSNEDFQTMLRFFKSNTITNGLRDSAYKLNNIEQKFSTIYDDWEQVYLRPGNN